jgi:ABC-type uncharacterized transport system substrate-binding protein
MMHRRAFLGAFGSFAISHVAEGRQAVTAAAAQKTRAIKRIGLLAPTDSGAVPPAFRRGMQELGYVENQNVAIEYRSARGQFDQLPRLAAELAGLDLEVMVTVFTQATLAAKQATQKTPIVMIAVADPVGAGLVTSLSRPGGNITGTSSIAGDIVGKQFEALREIARPGARVAVLWNPANAIFQVAMRQAAEHAGRSLGLQLRFLEVRASDDVDRAFADRSIRVIEAIVVLTDPVLVQSRRRIAELAARHHLPSVGESSAYAEVGGLIGYGPSYSDLARRAAHFVAKILRGTKPADLPVEQPTKFELVINLKTAKAMGLTIPPSLLQRADQVIE